MDHSLFIHSPADALGPLPLRGPVNNGALDVGVQTPESLLYKTPQTRGLLMYLTCSGGWKSGTQVWAGVVPLSPLFLSSPSAWDGVGKIWEGGSSDRAGGGMRGVCSTAQRGLWAGLGQGCREGGLCRALGPVSHVFCEMRSTLVLLLQQEWGEGWGVRGVVL